MLTSSGYSTIEDISKWDGELLIPRRLTIETIFGCNAKCRMCIIDHPTTRKKCIMSPDRFHNIVDEFADFKEHIEMVDLFGLGESLLDPHIFERLSYVKEKGFRNLAISTNADLLEKEKQHALLETGIDTVLFSIDGIKKQTHENIRRGVTYERVVENVQSIIEMRDAGNYETRFAIRFIKQPDNLAEWPDYKSFWQSRISPQRRDFIMVYDMHCWAGQIAAKDDILADRCRDDTIECKPCHHVFNIMTVLADGSVPLCSEDELCPQHDFGNAFELSPLEVYNSEKFRAFRRLHVEGTKNLIEPCKECTVLYSEAARASS